MINDDYERHLRVIGKLAYCYEYAAGDVTTAELNLSRLMDQAATGEGASWPAVKVFAPYVTSLAAAITAGASQLSSIVLAMARSYLLSTDFTDDLTNTPSSRTSVAAVLDAWILDMTADSKTFTTVSASGLVAFLLLCGTPTGTFPQSGSPTYADATYVKQALVTD